MNNNISNNLIIIIVIAYFVFFSGCVGNETTIPTETPTISKSPIPTTTVAQTPNLTETVLPTVTQTVVINVTSNESDIIPNSEYEVYSSVISSIISSDFSHKSVNKIVINQLTSNQAICYNFDCFENLKNYYDSMMLDDYKNKNANVYILENKFSTPQTVILISREEHNKIFNIEKGWETFYEKYPNSSGVISISRVGFNSDQTQAILYFSYQADWLWGKGCRIFLTKDEGKWIVKEQVSLFVS